MLRSTCPALGNPARGQPGSEDLSGPWPAGSWSLKQWFPIWQSVCRDASSCSVVMAIAAFPWCNGDTISWNGKKAPQYLFRDARGILQISSPPGFRLDEGDWTPVPVPVFLSLCRYAIGRPDLPLPPRRDGQGHCGYQIMNKIQYILIGLYFVGCDRWFSGGKMWKPIDPLLVCSKFMMVQWKR